ncbi:MAG: recombinase family protein [Bacillota bacterium]
MDKKAAIYVRVSTEEQAKDGVSIAAQIETLTQYCRLYGVEIYDIYKDLGASGKSISKRKGLQQLLKDASREEFGLLLVWKISRLSRSLKDLLNILDILDTYGISFVSYSEKLDTSTPTGKMTLQILGSIAEFERNSIIDNVKLGLQEFARTGGKATTVLGYDNVNKRLEINWKEANLVKSIFNYYLEYNYSFSAIADILNKRGFRTKRNNEFSSGSISEILKNPVYIGLNRHKLNSPDYYIVKGNHEPIIDMQTWDLVQKKINNCRRSKRIKCSNNALLKNLLYCPVCGGEFQIFYSGSKGYRYRYYKCKNTECRFMINADNIEKAVDKAILEFLCSDKVLNDIRSLNRNYVNNLCCDVERRLNELDDDINKQLKVINGYYQMYENDKISTIEKLEERIRNIEEQIHVMEHEKNQYKSIQANTFDSLSGILGKLEETHLQKLLELLKYDEKHALYSKLIRKIYIDKDRTISRISFNLPVCN